MPKTLKNPTTFAQEYVTILGVRVDSTSKEEVLNAVNKKVSSKTQFYIVTPNPEIINLAQSDPELSHSLKLADISVADGVGIVFAAKLQGKTINLVKGRELMLDILKLANKEKWKVFLLGASPEVNEKVVLKIKNDYPALRVKGNSGPILDNNAAPVSESDSSIESQVISEINAFKPHILFIAFGTPKEQKWITKHLKKLKVLGAMEVGGAFDYLVGAKKLPPKFLEGLGLEWLWRLLTDPKRITRIFNAVIIFPLLILKSRLKWPLT